VLHVTTVPESLVFLAGQAAFMRERGFELHVITSPGEGARAFEEREGVRTQTVRMARQITPVADLAALAELRGAIAALEPTIVHAHTPKGGLLGTMAAALARVPLRIYHMRGLPLLTQHGWKRQLLTQTERTSCALAHRVLCVSHSLRDVALEARLCRPGRIRVLGSGSGQGVDVERFRPSSAQERLAVRAELGIAPDAIAFVFVGRLVRDKGVRELAQAWARVRESVPDATLAIAGAQDTRDAVSADDLRAFTEDPRVRMLGFRRDMPRVLAAMDVVVLPTFREGFPNVALEAAAMGLPLVGTRAVGCVDAVVDGETGLLVEPGEAEPLAEAMTRYARSAAMRNAHGAAARERVCREFTRERVWQLLADEYAELLERASRAGRPQGARRA
jgi:glycosyltransferase involved in cell wall biosynthesis